MEQAPRYVGIDVAKAKVDVAVRPTDRKWAISYDESGVRELISQMEEMSPALVVLEASGGLELPLVAALAAAALPVVVVNPVRSGTLPEPQGRWLRPTLWTPRSWPTSPPPFGHPYALCGTPRPRPSTPWLPADTR